MELSARKPIRPGSSVILRQVAKTGHSRIFATILTNALQTEVILPTRGILTAKLLNKISESDAAQLIGYVTAEYFFDVNSAAQ